MDIDLLSAKESIDFELTMPDGSPSGVSFDVVGQYSPGYNVIAAKVNDILSKVEGGEAEKAERRVIETAIACIKGWTGVEKDKKPLEFNESNCREFLDNPSRHWIATRIYLRVIGEKGFFSKA